MEDEAFINGFCKTQNQGRMVSIEFEQQGTRRELLDAGCDYGHCVHQESCLIAKRIREEFGGKV